LSVTQVRNRWEGTIWLPVQKLFAAGHLLFVILYDRASLASLALSWIRWSLWVCLITGHYWHLLTFFRRKYACLLLKNNGRQPSFVLLASIML
jgi:hypothetical protein